MKFYPKILGPSQVLALRALAPALRTTDFYLAGGTALALQLGHRRSVDLDWFTASLFVNPKRFADQLAKELDFRTDQIDEGTLLGRISRTRMSFLEQRSPFLGPLVHCPALNCELASLADLAAMKINAIGGRGAKKDFVDIFALGQRGIALSQMISWFVEKFGVRNTYHTINSLSYFEDADKQPMPPLLWSMNWRSVKKTIREWVKEL
jgi:Nucleotidyl transferase AbiEii toxin, Type IV TA system